MKRIKYLAFIVLVAAGISGCASKSDRTAEMLAKLEVGEIPAEVEVYNVNVSQSEVTWSAQYVTGNGHFGTIGVKEGSLYVYNEKVLGGKFTIDMNQIVVVDITDPERNARLKGHLDSDDFFSVATYPEAILEIASAEMIEGAADDAPNYKVTANLTIKNITHGLAFDARIDLDSGRLNATSDVVFDRSLYEVKFRSGRFYENLGDNLILDDVSLGVKLVAGL